MTDYSPKFMIARLAMQEALKDFQKPHCDKELKEIDRILILCECIAHDYGKREANHD